MKEVSNADRQEIVARSTNRAETRISHFDDEGALCSAFEA
jgi:hypothetical protein